jgi:hypothetical protein
MMAFALLFGLLALRANPATPVLAVSQPVAAGQTITDADLEVVRVVPDASLEVVTDVERSAVVGRTATVPLAAGSLLSPAQVGPAAWPPVGESVIAVPVAAGRLPAGLSAGSRVTVLVPSGGETNTAPAPASALVVAVEAASAAGVSPVSLLLASSQARQVAAAGGEVVLILESPGSGR